eukprot:11180187-Lingulodinium_polyedra.AAC.1
MRACLRACVRALRSHFGSSGHFAQHGVSFLPVTCNTEAPARPPLPRARPRDGASPPLGRGAAAGRPRFAQGLA